MTATPPDGSPEVELELPARVRDLGGGVNVRRVLPASARRMVGPFIFFDHMGPVTGEPGFGFDVRPHPHINLATVTFLYEGEMVHRDSLGSEQVIRPGAVNWMTAGRGIAHSERSPAAERKAGARLQGLQLWVALPRALEEAEPSFQHHPADTLPELEVGGARLKLLAGSAYGARAPVAVSSPLHYVDATLDRGVTLDMPEGVDERAAYVVSGQVAAEGRLFGEGRMIVFRAGGPARVQATERGARLALVGGAPLDGERHIWWNFVSSSRERIERAKEDWREGRFARIPGDDQEFIPLPAA